LGCPHALTFNFKISVAKVVYYPIDFSATFHFNLSDRVHGYSQKCDHIFGQCCQRKVLLGFLSSTQPTAIALTLTQVTASDGTPLALESGRILATNGQIHGSLSQWNGRAII
jgi:hypothetical protein